MRNLPVKFKLLALVAVALLTLVGVGAAGNLAINRAAEALAEVAGTTQPAILALKSIDEAKTALNALNTETALWENQPGARASFAQIVSRKDDAWARIVSSRKAYEPLSRTAEEQALWRQFAGEWQAWQKADGELPETIAELGRTRDAERRKELYDQFYRQFDAQKPDFAAVEGTLRKLVEANTRRAEEAAAAGSKAVGIFVPVMLGVSAGAVVLMVVLGLYAARLIAAPLESMREAISEVAQTGDLTRRIPPRGAAEAVHTIEAFNAMAERMQAAMHEVLDNAAALSGSAGALSDESGRAAEAAAGQAQASSAMAASVEQMTVSINHVSEGSREVLEVSRRAGSLADQGGEVVRQAAREMDGIAATVAKAAETLEALSAQANRIAAVTKLIKDIADQTNLLALNAAIEAARAGDQGRGFAVVADEVRNLAERTTRSTEDIARMVGGIRGGTEEAVASIRLAVARVQTGQGLAAQADALIGQITGAARDVVTAVGEISAALREQSAAANEIAGNVEKVALQTEAGQAAASRTAEQSRRVESLAAAMREAVGVFRV
ncbi:MAG: methyl-accepting chemotaxis protein [Rhodocyclales bacterium]|nr:methyl-accepting chemotaxis protein [Rhodocyclales bacterium]